MVYEFRPNNILKLSSYIKENNVSPLQRAIAKSRLRKS
jgi:hypothetical protein